MLATFLQYLIAHGVPENTVTFMLYLPLLATVVTFSRYILGIKSLTIYASLLLTFALFQLAQTGRGAVDLTTGLIHGGVLIITTTIIAFILQSLTKEIRMHYLAKVSLILTSVCIAVLFLMYIFIQFNSHTFVNLNPLSIVIIILVIDIFMRGYLRKGSDKSALLITQTIILSYTLFFIMAQPTIAEFLIDHPEIVLYSILINIFIGRWKGFRWSEYVRFKNIKLPEPADTYDTTYTQEK